MAKPDSSQNQPPDTAAFIQTGHANGRQPTARELADAMSGAMSVIEEDGLLLQPIGDSGNISLLVGKVEDTASPLQPSRDKDHTLSASERREHNRGQTAAAKTPVSPVRPTVHSPGSYLEPWHRHSGKQRRGRYHNRPQANRH